MILAYNRSNFLLYNWGLANSFQLFFGNSKTLEMNIFLGNNKPFPVELYNEEKSQLKKKIK